MDCVERQVTEPGFSMVFLDEGDRLAAKSIGSVIDLADRICAAQNGVMLVSRGIEVIVHAPKETEILVESSLERVKLREVAQMRLAKPAGGIAQCLEAVADGLLLQRQAEIYGG